MSVEPEPHPTLSLGRYQLQDQLINILFLLLTIVMIFRYQSCHCQVSQWIAQVHLVDQLLGVRRVVVWETEKTIEQRQGLRTRKKSRLVQTQIQPKILQGREKLVGRKGPIANNCYSQEESREDLETRIVEVTAVQAGASHLTRPVNRTLSKNLLPT